MNRTRLGTSMPATFHPVNDNTLFADDFTGDDIRSGLAAMAGLCRQPALKPRPARSAAIISGLAAAIVLAWGAAHETPSVEAVNFLGFEDHEIFRHWGEALHAAQVIAHLSNLTIPKGALCHDTRI